MSLCRLIYFSLFVCTSPGATSDVMATPFQSRKPIVLESSRGQSESSPKELTEKPESPPTTKPGEKTAPKPAPEKQPAQRFNEEQLKQFVKDLSNEKFVVRRQATENLLKAGSQAVPVLKAAIETGDLETRLRAFKCFDRLLTGDKVTAVEVTWLALESLANSKNEQVENRSRTLLSRHGAVRGKMLLSKLTELNAVVDSNPGDSLPRTIVKIDQYWTGGDDGLKYVKLLAQKGVQPRPDIYLIRGAPISKSAVKNLEDSLSGALRFQERGSASLGISGSAFFGGTNGVMIAQVLSNGSADKAGLVERDVITRFDGSEVASFETLIELIGKREPGDKVDIKYLRRGNPTPRTTTATLLPWRISPRASEKTKPAPKVPAPVRPDSKPNPFNR